MTNRKRQLDLSRRDQGLDSDKVSADEVFCDQLLVEELKQGKPSAVKKWYKTFYPYLLLVAKNKLPSLKDAEDIVQEVMINALRRIHLFRGGSSLKTWMTSILRHEIADYYRKIYAKKALQIVPLSKHFFAKPVKDSEDLQETIREILGEMPASKKALLLMKYVDELRVKDIAQKLGKSIKAVESDIWRSKELFKQLYNRAVSEE